MLRLMLLWFAVCLLPLPTLAHVTEDATALTSDSWSFEPWVLACLGLSIVLYVIGALRLGYRARSGRNTIKQAVYFLLGWLALVAALVSPVDALGSQLFSAHMVQHELLMVVAAPLLVMSRPLAVWLWAMPVNLRHAIGEAIRHPLVRLPWHLLSLPSAAWIIHALTLWLWHIPLFFNTALISNALHTFQHLSFLITALFFWWAVLGEQVSPAKSGMAMIYLFTTMIHTGALGALMTFSSAAWYLPYHETSQAFGLSPAEDQQLGGLIMWVPGGIAYVVAGVMLGARWIQLGIRPYRAGAD